MTDKDRSIIEPPEPAGPFDPAEHAAQVRQQIAALDADARTYPGTNYPYKDHRYETMIGKGN